MNYVEEAIALLVRIGFFRQEAHQCYRAVLTPQVTIFRDRFLALGGTAEQWIIIERAFLRSHQGQRRTA